MCPGYPPKSIGTLRHIMTKVFCAILITAPFYDNSSRSFRSECYTLSISIISFRAKFNFSMPGQALPGRAGVVAEYLVRIGVRISENARLKRSHEKFKISISDCYRFFVWIWVGSSGILCINTDTLPEVKLIYLLFIMHF